MSSSGDDRVTRRRFLGQAALAGGVGGLALSASRRGVAAPAATPLPVRQLGRTGVQLPILGLGAACVGQSRAVSFDQAKDVIAAAVDQGLTFIDCARGYDKAEDVLGAVLGGRRDQVFLTTKAGANSPDGCQRSFDDSLRRLKTDHVDLLYWHEVGGRDTRRGLEPDGVMAWLAAQKQAGKARLVGITAHQRAGNLLPLVESGQVDALMVVLNYVDRHQYNFEETVLPAARRHGVGVIGMKVLGGERGQDWGRYGGPNPGPQVGDAQVETALRYALSLEGVTSAVVGMHTVDQVRQNLAIAARFEPLAADEMARLVDAGRALAKEWGPRFGPTA
jgi:aryl-alcohol dehydrogenase-like predicted oxidoreductase